MNYYVSNDAKGKLSISSNVFVQLAKSKLEDLAKHEYKDSISLTFKDKRENVKCSIDMKNKVTLNIFVNAYRNSDMQKAVATIQQSIYDAIYELTEISSISVNVSVVGFVENK